MSRILTLLAVSTALIPLGLAAENPVVPRKPENKTPAIVYIEATEPSGAPKEWRPRETPVKVGDVIEWHVKKGTHGVVFKDWGMAGKILKVDKSVSLKIETQPGFPSPAQGTKALTASGDKSRLLLRATVMALPAAMPDIEFVCTRDGEKMPGKLLLRTDAVRSKK